MEVNEKIILSLIGLATTIVVAYKEIEIEKIKMSQQTVKQ